MTPTSHSAAAWLRPVPRHTVRAAACRMARAAAASPLGDWSRKWARCSGACHLATGRPAAAAARCIRRPPSCRCLALRPAARAPAWGRLRMPGRLPAAPVPHRRGMGRRRCCRRCAHRSSGRSMSSPLSVRLLRGIRRRTRHSSTGSSHRSSSRRRRNVTRRRARPASPARGLRRPARGQFAPAATSRRGPLVAHPLAPLGGPGTLGTLSRAMAQSLGLREGPPQAWRRREAGRTCGMTTPRRRPVCAAVSRRRSIRSECQGRAGRLEV